MATPTLTRHVVPGALGDILVDVRAAGRTSPRPAALVLHGFKGFKDWGMFPPFAERLAQAGFTAVSCNLSGSGVDAAGEFALPDRFARDTYSAELADAAAVLAALRAGALDVAPPSSVGLVGHSRGGGVAVLLAAREAASADASADASANASANAGAAAPLRALVTWSAIARVDRWSAEQKAEWRRRGTLDVVNTRTGQVLPLATDVLDDVERHAAELDIRAAAARVAAPWLILHGGADESVPPDEARELFAASGHATTRIEVVEGAGHTFGAVHPWAGWPAPFRHASDLTVAWLARWLE